MAGKVAVLNDLAGFGRCSLTAAISVLSAMGVQPCPLPTAVLSAQTGFESYFFQDLTEQMGMITEEWKKSGSQFDGIVTGFMSDHRQIGEVNHFLDLFHKEGTFLLVDPVLGDNGKRFSVFDGLFQKEMKQLVKRADIVTPNVTELCLLTDYDYDKIQNISETGDREALFSEVSKAAGRLLDSGVSEVIVTGVLFEEQDAAKECTVGKETGTGGRKVANLTVTREKTTAGISSFIGASYSGTGDLFASVIAGGKARGDRTEDSVRLAGEMIELISSGVPNVICIQPFACLPNHVVGKGVIKVLKKNYPQANIAAVDYDPGASEVNQLNRIKLMLSVAKENMK